MPNLKLLPLGVFCRFGGAVRRCGYLYGHLACNSLELTGDLIFCGGCVFETPPSSFNMAHVGGALRLQDSLPVFVKIADGNPADGTYEILTADGGLPADISLFRLAGLSGRRTCTFSKSGNTLLATIADADICVWTGAAGDGKFSTAGNWADGVKPTSSGNRPILFASTSAGTVNNDIGQLSPAYIEFRAECAATAVSGFKLTLPPGAAITVLADFQPNFEAPVEFANEIHAVGKVRFAGGVTGLDIHADMAELLGSYGIASSDAWTPKGRHVVAAGSSLNVDQYRSELKDNGSCCVSVLQGGTFTCRLAQVAQDSKFVNVNHGVVEVTGTATFMDGTTRITPGSESTGEFRFNKIVVNRGALEFNARESNWQDANSITSNVNMVMGPGGLNFVDGDAFLFWDRGVAFGCTADWTLCARLNGDYGGRVVVPHSHMSLYFDTSDYDNHSVKRTVTIEGKVIGDNSYVAAYGGGTIKFSCDDADQFRGGFAALDATTLEYASSSARAGSGDVLLAPGSTLALPTAGSGPVSIAGALASTNGVGTVYVRLGPAGSVVQPGSYSIAIAEGGVDSELLRHLSLVNGIRGSNATFGMAADSKTLVASIVVPPLELSSGEYLSVPEGGLAFDSFTVTDASRENPVFVLVGDGGTLPDGTNLVLTASSLPVQPPYEYLSLANAMPDSCYAAFWREGDSIYVSVRPLGWVNEKADSASMTGQWTRDVVYDENGLAKLVGETVFEPHSVSTGNVVTVETTLQLNACDDSAPDAEAQAAMRLFTNGCLQVWTLIRDGNGAHAGWVDVEADGLVPVGGMEYTVRFTVNYTANAYSVDIAFDAAEFASLREKGGSARRTFRLATSANCVSSVEINGDTSFKSLLGECRLMALGFAADDILVLKDNVEVVLGAAKAAWLNKCAGGDKSAVESAAAGLTEQEFSDAYLLNVDVAGDRTYSLKVTGIDVSDESVTVGVELKRSDKIDQPINGVLKLYGAETLSAFKIGTDAAIATAVVSDETFSNGDTATGEFEIGDEAKAKFLKAKIE